ncbi:hypothetical protein ACF1G0_33380 [Streptomyces sp. NPDC013953]|uniref:hypothetical protein n=1 Tax=Streptomyces sp. NPDC013953 TaxID=3364868 RepID=UPI0037021162
MPYEDTSAAADAVLEQSPRLLPRHVRALLDASESEPPAPPVPTRCTVLYDVGDDEEDQPPAGHFFGCLRS